METDREKAERLKFEAMSQTHETLQMVADWRAEKVQREMAPDAPAPAWEPQPAVRHAPPEACWTPPPQRQKQAPKPPPAPPPARDWSAEQKWVEAIINQTVGKATLKYIGEFGEGFAGEAVALMREREDKLRAEFRQQLDALRAELLTADAKGMREAADRMIASNERVLAKLDDLQRSRPGDDRDDEIERTGLPH